MSERLSRMVTVYLTETEYEELTNLARRKNKSVSGLLIDCVGKATHISFRAREPRHRGGVMQNA